ncbi:MAG: hypothetical protein WCQ57_05240 [Verrucomicrobiota bacterium]
MSFAGLVEDALFQTIADRLVVLSNGMMSHFASTTCEVAQHVKISYETGTAEDGGLFNQENVPADTLFYSVLNATKSRVPGGEFKEKTPEDAFAEFGKKSPISTTSSNSAETPPRVSGFARSPLTNQYRLANLANYDHCQYARSEDPALPAR